MCAVGTFFFCFWWYPRGIKVTKNRLKNSHNFYRSYTDDDERKSSSGTLNDILIGAQCVEFCVFLCNFTYDRTLTVKTFFSFIIFLFSWANIVSQFLMLVYLSWKRIFSMSTAYPHVYIQNKSLLSTSNGEYEGKKGKWHLLYRISTSSRWK